MGEVEGKAEEEDSRKGKREEGWRAKEMEASPTQEGQVPKREAEDQGARYSRREQEEEEEQEKIPPEEVDPPRPLMWVRGRAGRREILQAPLCATCMLENEMEGQAPGSEDFVRQALRRIDRYDAGLSRERWERIRGRPSRSDTSGGVPARSTDEVRYLFTFNFPPGLIGYCLK